MNRFYTMTFITLLSAACGAHAMDKSLNAQLIEATRTGSFDECATLLENGADVNAADRFNNTSLRWAAYEGHTQIVELLLQNGAKPLHINKENEIKLMCTGAEPWHPYKQLSAILLLIKQQTLNLPKALLNSNIKDCSISEALMQQALLISDKGKISTQLLDAAREGNLLLTKLLLKYGAEVNTTNSFGDTPLYWAASNGHIDIVKLLIQNGTKVNTVDNDGDTPLYRAALFEHIDIENLLIQNGADVNEANYKFIQGFR